MSRPKLYQKIFSNNGLSSSFKSEAMEPTLSSYANLSGASFTGGIHEATVAMNSGEINLSSGNCFTKTITEDTVLSITGAAGSSYFTLVLTNGGGATITYPENMKWGEGEPPSLTARGIDVLSFVSPDDGLNWYGSVSLKNASPAIIPTFWNTIRQNVRQGLGPTMYPVGTQFTTEQGSNTFVWDVVHHCVINDSGTLVETATSGGSPCMVLQMHQCFNAILNGSLASMYCVDAIPVGEYKISGMRDNQYDEGGAATYSFTTTEEIPAGGKIHIPGMSSQVTFTTYDSNCNIIERGTANKTSSETATLLGSQWGGYSTHKIASDNFPFRMSVQGNPYWVQSSLRQYLNSSASGSWFTPWRLQAPDWNVTTGFISGGFIRRLPSDFVAVIASVKHYTGDWAGGRSPAMTPPASSEDFDWVTDRFWIPNGKQVGGTAEEGCFNFYQTPENRIKTLLGTSNAVAWRITRSVMEYLWNTGGVSTTGSVGLNCRCADQNGVAPCCVIV